MPSALVLYNEYTRREIHDAFDPERPFTPQRGTWEILGLIALPDRPGDFVFLVTYGQSQGDHIFDEGISPEGLLRWQSQPRQTLSDNIIQQLIHHDEDRHSIYLFLRTTERQHGAPRPYTYLGRLKYIEHYQRERPVYFLWQLLDWPIPPAELTRIGLRLDEPSQDRRPSILHEFPPAGTLVEQLPPT